MLEKFSIGVTYEIDGQKYINKTLNNDFYEIVVEQFQGEHLRLLFIPRKKLKLVSVRLSYNYHYDADSIIFGNGYQSWSLSEEKSLTDREYGLRGISKLPLIKKIASIYGDYNFYKYPDTAGVFHGWTYGYVRDGEVLALYGSLSEREGFTLFTFDTVNGDLRITKELDGLETESPFMLLDVIRLDGTEDEVFDAYFDAMNLRKRDERYTGYTSWYNYFGNINEDIILRDLDAMHDLLGDSANLFQIDDGWQSKVGDWMIIDDKKFPHGMKYLADKIHEKGYKAGLWLAPFLADRKSRLFSEHPEWLVYDDKSMEPVFGNFGWGGAYSVNIYNPQARAYIEKCLSTVLDDWGFDMVKLDFLYAECIIPRSGKNRGMIMSEAMDLLREAVGKKLLLACGSPVGTTFGNADIMRTGSDVDISYNKKKSIKNIKWNNEVYSTLSSIINTISRRGLSGRAFLNDPDVFILRDTNCDYTEAQKQTLAIINWIFGDVLFVSDNVGEYSEEHKTLIKKLFSTPKPKLNKVDFSQGLLKVEFVSEGQSYLFEARLSDGSNSVTKL